MSTHRLQLSKTQSLALQLLNDPQVTELLFGGGAGGAKTVLVCIWMVLECRNYPGIRIGLGREELVRLKQSTVVTLLSKAHGYLGVSPEEFVYNEQRGVVTYLNGSQIQLVDMAWHPSDPNYDTFGSLEFTHVVIEEAGEVRKKAVDILGSRKNRFMNSEYGVVGKTVLTCNPTQNFVRTEYYEPYKALGMGQYQKWENGQVELPTGEVVASYRAFIKSLAADNPFISRNYIEELKRKPLAERKRLLEGNWDYDAGDYMLFTDQILDRATTPELQTGRKVVFADLADGGKDESVISLVEEGVLVEQQMIELGPTEGLDPSQADPAERNALAIIRFCQQRGVEATDVGIDGLGIGAGTRVALRNKGWFIQVYIGGGSPVESGFGNLRDEQFYKTSQDMQNGAFKIYAQLPTRTELRRQFKPHEWVNTGKVIKVTSKDTGQHSIKAFLGRSPDNADSAVGARWMWSKDRVDPKHDQSRIGF